MYSPSFDINYYQLWNQNETKEVNLYQPPLSAYSPEYSGSSNLKFNYHINPNSTQIISPLIQIKMNKLNMIKYWGYKSLKPIGLNKTMEQVDMETRDESDNSIQNNDNDNDNDNDNNEGNDNEGNHHDGNDNNNITNERHDDDLDIGNDNIGDLAINTQDMDDDIPNLDSDDGFMAHDVEYQDDQDDHSIAHEDMILDDTN